MLKQNNIWERKWECGRILLLTHSGISTLSVNKKNTLRFNRESGMWLGYWEEQKFSQNVLLFPISPFLMLLNYCVLIKFTDAYFLKRKLFYWNKCIFSPICEIWFFIVWQVKDEPLKKSFLFCSVLPKPVAFFSGWKWRIDSIIYWRYNSITIDNFSIKINTLLFWSRG